MTLPHVAVQMFALFSSCILGCSSLESQTATSAAAASFSAQELYASVATRPTGAEVKAFAATPLGDYFTNLISSASNASVVVNGQELTGLHDRLLQNKSYFASLSSQYGNVGAYWQALGYDPLATVNEGNYITALDAMMATLRGQADALGLLGNGCSQDSLGARLNSYFAAIPKADLPKDPINNIIVELAHAEMLGRLQVSTRASGVTKSTTVPPNQSGQFVGPGQSTLECGTIVNAIDPEGTEFKRVITNPSSNGVKFYFGEVSKDGRATWYEVPQLPSGQQSQTCTSC